MVAIIVRVVKSAVILMIVIGAKTAQSAKSARIVQNVRIVENASIARIV